MRDGRVRRSWIGLDVQPILKSSSVARGALVGGAVEGSPAAKAGFAAGDVLREARRPDVNVRFAEEVPLFNQLVMRLPIGKPIAAVVVARRRRTHADGRPEERESVEAPVHELPALGITASNLTTWSAKELRRVDRTGVRVNGVRPGRPGRRCQAVARQRRRDRVDRREAGRRRRGAGGAIELADRGAEGRCARSSHSSARANGC